MLIELDIFSYSKLPDPNCQNIILELFRKDYAGCERHGLNFRGEVRVLSGLVDADLAATDEDKRKKSPD